MSPEYASRNRTNSEYVQDLYYAFLQRGGDLAGFNFWVNALDDRYTHARTGQDAVPEQSGNAGEYRVDGRARLPALIAQAATTWGLTTLPHRVDGNRSRAVNERASCWQRAVVVATPALKPGVLAALRRPYRRTLSELPNDLAVGQSGLGGRSIRRRCSPVADRVDGASIDAPVSANDAKPSATGRRDAGSARSTRRRRRYGRQPCAADKRNGILHFRTGQELLAHLFARQRTCS